MQAIEKNISRHKNGTLYFIARRQGKLMVRSLKTQDLAEARGKIARLASTAIADQMKSDQNMGAMKAGAALAISGGGRASVINPEQSSPLQPSPAEWSMAATAAEPNPIFQKGQRQATTIAEALEEHKKHIILLSDSSKEMADRARKAILSYAQSWNDSMSVDVWKAYRESGIERFGHELGSAANHLRWFLQKFIPWAVAHGYLGPVALVSLKSIPKIKVNSRIIRVPPVETVDEFLKMVSSEDPEGGLFLRYLSASGSRRGGALGLCRRNVDLETGKVTIRQKGGYSKTIDLLPEALDILKYQLSGRNSRVFNLDQNAIERLERIMKRYAKGFDIDLNTFHSFRHYFASLCLINGLSPKEVAELLGHSDGGVLVLKTYGHLCSTHLRRSISQLRLTSNQPLNLPPAPGTVELGQSGSDAGKNLIT